MSKAQEFITTISESIVDVVVLKTNIMQFKDEMNKLALLMKKDPKSSEVSQQFKFVKKVYKVIGDKIKELESSMPK